ncbi:MAG: hypothetical protein LBP54_01355 [Campylobacteraceae bacterium]|jgi:hypothetical protein|nr:hypothetical protein [Campylobacteraceae bacterium]
MIRTVLIGLMAVFGFCGEISEEKMPLKDLSAQRLNLLHERGTAQYKDLTPINAIDLGKYDFAPLFMDAKEDDCNFLGYIGDDFWRLYIVFDEIKKIAPLKYSAKGQTMTKENYCDFEGEITINQAYRYKEFSGGIDDEMAGKIADQGVIFAKIVLRENSKQKGSGVFTGDLMTNWYIDMNGSLRYDDIEYYSDSFANNQFLGVWTSYKTGAQKRTAWGQYRIPMSKGLDVGAGMFIVDEKYWDNGWITKDEEERKLCKFGGGCEPLCESVKFKRTNSPAISQ